MSTLNQIDAVNAVVEAWTRKGSPPFCNRIDVPAGSSASVTVNQPFYGFLLAFGYNGAHTGIYQLGLDSGGSVAINKAVAAATDLTITRSGAVYTMTNANASHSVIVYLFTLEGSAQ